MNIWSLAVTLSGANTLRAKVTSQAANESAASAGLTITVDETAPKASPVVVPAQVYADYQSGSGTTAFGFKYTTALGRRCAQRGRQV